VPKIEATDRPRAGRLTAASSSSAWDFVCVGAVAEGEERRAEQTGELVLLAG
jgi:hypothetical protein